MLSCAALFYLGDPFPTLPPWKGGQLSGSEKHHIPSPISAAPGNGAQTRAQLWASCGSRRAPWGEGGGAYKEKALDPSDGNGHFREVSSQDRASQVPGLVRGESTPLASLPCLPIHSKSAFEAWGGATWQQSGEGPGPSSLNLCGWRHPESQGGGGRSRQGRGVMCGSEGGTPPWSGEKGPGAE